MSEVIKKIRWALSQSYLHIIFGVMATLVFLFILFPFSDLSDLISSQIAQQTNNQINLRFSGMEPTFQPQPGLKLEDVYFESAFMPAIKMASVSLSPALSALTKSQPHGKVSAKGLWGGNVTVSSKQGEATGEGVERESINLTLEDLNLSKIVSFASLPIQLQGQISGDAQALTDLDLAVQPQIEINLKIANFTLPNAPVESPMGPITLPEIKLKNVTIKGRLIDGQIVIEEGDIGESSDEIAGTLKGTIALRLLKMGPNIVPQFGVYNLDLDLKVKQAFLARADLIFQVLDQLIPANQKSSIISKIPGGTRYAMKVTGTPGGSPLIRGL